MRRFGQSGVAERALEMKAALGPHLMGCEACENFRTDDDDHIEANADAFLDFLSEMTLAFLEVLVEEGEEEDSIQRGTD
jgi:hypothetical protein